MTKHTHTFSGSVPGAEDIANTSTNDQNRLKPCLHGAYILAGGETESTK